MQTRFQTFKRLIPKFVLYYMHNYFLMMILCIYKFIINIVKFVINVLGERVVQRFRREKQTNCRTSCKIIRD